MFHETMTPEDVQEKIAEQDATINWALTAMAWGHSIRSNQAASERWQQAMDEKTRLLALLNALEE